MPMKFHVILLIINLLAWFSCVDLSPKLNCNVSIEGNNLLYTDVPNTIHIEGLNSRGNSLKLKVNEKYLPPSEENRFKVLLEKPGISTLTLLDTIKNKVLAKKVFKVKELPLPILSLDNVSPLEYQVYKKQILASKYLWSEIYNIDISVQCPVISFSILAKKANQEYKLHSSSNKLTLEQKEYIKTLESKKHIIITDVFVQTPNGKVRKLPSIVYELI